MSTNVVTNWKNLNLYAELTDIKNTDILFYQQHPEMVGKKISAGNPLVKDWMLLRDYEVQNKYNSIIEDSVAQFPMITARVLKALIVQESRFQPSVINSYGFVGLCQFGVTSGREEGLIINNYRDERLDPKMSIMAATRHLNHKYLAIKGNLDKYQILDNEEIIKFILGSYNGGQGTINYALNTSKTPQTWVDIYTPVNDFKRTALYAATKYYFGNIKGNDLSIAKYNEIRKYPELITALAAREE